MVEEWRCLSAVHFNLFFKSILYRRGVLDGGRSCQSLHEGEAAEGDDQERADEVFEGHELVVVEPPVEHRFHL